MDVISTVEKHSMDSSGSKITSFFPMVTYGQAWGAKVPPRRSASCPIPETPLMQRTVSATLFDFSQEKATSILMATLSNASPNAISALYHIGNAWNALGDKKKAIEYFEEALKICEVFHCNDLSSTTSILSSLGNIYNELGETKRAIVYYEKALEIFKAQVNNQYADTINMLNDMANAFKALGYVKETIPYYQEILFLYKTENFHDFKKQLIETIKQLKEKSPQAAKLLSFCTYLNTNGIPLYWLENWNKEKALSSNQTNFLQELINPLIETSLLQWEKPQESFQIRPLVQLITQESLSQEEQFQFYCDAFTLVKGYLALYRYKDLSTWQHGQESLPHAIKIGEHAREKKIFLKEEVKLYNEIGLYLSMRGNFLGARKYHEKALTIKNHFHHPDDAEIGMLLNNLGSVYYNLQDYEKAKEYYEKAFEIRKGLYGLRFPEVASVLNNLGNVYYELKDFERAKAYQKQALTIQKAIYGETHPSVVITLNHLSKTLFAMEDKEKAKAKHYGERALQLAFQVYDKKHPSVAIILSNLGGLFLSENNYAKAREYYSQALTINREIFGENHPRTLKNKNELNILVEKVLSAQS